MNGLMLGTWLPSSLEADSQRKHAAGPGAFAFAHNVPTQHDVQPTLDYLARFGGTILRTADAPPQAASAATSPIPTAMPGRSRGIPPGRSTPRVT
jgi:hypothetical protein